MHNKKITLIYGNYPSNERLYDFMLPLKRFFIGHGFSVTSSRNLRANTTNIIIEEFCEDPFLIEKMEKFKLQKKGKIVVVLTEFLTGNYLNSFSLKTRFINALAHVYFNMPTIHKKTQRTLQSTIQKTDRPSLSATEKFLVCILKKFKTGEMNIAYDIAEINYFHRRLNGINYAIPYVDLWLGYYRDQIKNWKSLLSNIVLFNFSPPHYKKNSESKKKYDFYFSGKLTQKRKKILDQLNKHFKVYYPKKGYLSPQERDAILKESKFLLCLPRTDNWPYSSATRSWNALENGVIPINLNRYVLTDWEAHLGLPQVNLFTVKELKLLLYRYDEIRSRVILKCQNNKNFAAVDLLESINTI